MQVGSRTALATPAHARCPIGLQTQVGAIPLQLILYMRTNSHIRSTHCAYCTSQQQRLQANRPPPPAAAAGAWGT
jgi:hypothetical protein